jgi:protease IV
METIKKIGLLLLVIALLAVSSTIVAVALSFGGASTSFANGNVAVIPITGVISMDDGGWSDTVDPAVVRSFIERAENDERIKAIVIEINTPGGSAVATDEIGQALKATTKPTVAWVREYGASGGYWIASNTDHIIANRMSITGSIGVTASYIEFAGTLKRYNATYQQVASGEYKEMGSPWKELTPEEQALLQKKIDLIHEYFVDEVQANRNLSNKTMQQVRTGEIFLGVEALELGLVDELGSYNEVDAHINATIGEEPVYVRYEQPRSIFENFALLKSSFEPGTRLELRT